MLKEILVWWSRQMRDLLPDHWLGRWDDRSGALLVEPAESDSGLPPYRGVALRERRSGTERLLGRFALDPAGLNDLRQMISRRRPKRSVLLLPQDALLERTVFLPLAAERDWTSVMRFEMDRLTPFSASDVFWSGIVPGRDRPQGRLQLLLSLVPRAGVDQLLASLALAGLRPDAMQALAPDGQIRSIGLERMASRGMIWLHRAVAAISAICAALALAAVALPFLMQSRELHRVDSLIAALNPTVQQAEALRRTALERAARNSAIAARRQGSGDAMAVLAAVTDALPDDTYLQELSLDHGRLNLAGQSGEAARLIAVLTGNGRIRNPVFSAPVTRNEVVHADVFSIRAEVGP
jgi:general secretion pathway protein L